MNLKVIGTGSSGNAYSITDNTGHMLLLDAGLSYNSILRGIDFNTTKIDGVLISHHHL
jgi:phosphoribosyl 1,2-cyclic phosphodiesterase